jgi:hypothetical protein
MQARGSEGSMKDEWTWLALVVSCVLFPGCSAIYYAHPGTLSPALAQISPAERTALWQRAVPALLDEGYVPQVMNEHAGYISARRREDLVGDALIGTMATVVITTEGKVRVEVSGSGYFRSEEDFRGAVRERQQSLMNRIVSGTALPRS